MIDKMEIIRNVWKSGDKENKKRIENERLLIENFAYKCIEEFEKEVSKKPKKSMTENLFGGKKDLNPNSKDLFKF